MAQYAVNETDTVVIGASAAGLATAVCLQKANISTILLEQHEHVAHAWRNHYDRLHLHTNRSASGLPHLKMPAHYPKYPSRAQVVAYLEQYAAHFGLMPRFNQCVTAVTRNGTRWQVQTTDSSYQAQNVVIATGYTRVPHVPSWPGQSNFQGQILHSSAYKNGRSYKEQPVLVVGFGNSACEIALDLCEHGAHTSISVRSPVNVLPRDLLGIPILSIGILMNPLPPAVADTLAAPLIRLTVGDISRYGLRKLPYGPNIQIKKHGQVPLLDIGTMAEIKAGRIHVRPAIHHFTDDGVQFRDGTQQPFRAVILGTGYRPAVSDFLNDAALALDDQGVPLVSGGKTAVPGLYFCGFYVAATGMLREINIEARKIARLIAQSGKPAGSFTR